MYETAISLLRRLRQMLADGREFSHLSDVDSALEGDDSALTAFLTSNALWGGSGSIADQALGGSRETRRPLEQLLAELGREQIRLGLTNSRTATWTSVFDQWQAQNI
jgi:hypothetical protein